MYQGKEELIKCAKNEKMSIICKNFASKVKVDISKLLFFYSGDIINNINNKTFYELATKLDRESKVMFILVEEYGEFDLINYLDSSLKKYYQESQKKNLENYHLMKLTKYLSL